ncbi:MAG TPA: hypothetical protein VLW45_01400 [Pelomicrobium sp.]|nr:hypothetical protein [Pelomicrobium sp.]
MEIDRLSVAVRPRRDWEAMDLGFRLARACAGPLFVSFLAVLVPVTLLIALAMFSAPEYAPLVLWWLKPLLDRAPLHVLSRAVFGEVPTVRETLRALPKAAWNGLIASLTWRRIHSRRSFVLPVWQLEGQRGSSWRARVGILSRRAGGGATWLTIACLHLELALNIGFYGLLWLLLPQSIELDLRGVFTGAQPQWFEFVELAFYAAAVAIIEPFYVAAGFALYLNRRTLLEGWDLEIAFRRMAARLENREGRDAA